MPLAQAAPRIDVNALLPWRVFSTTEIGSVMGRRRGDLTRSMTEPGRSERKHRLFEKDHLTAGVCCPVLTGLWRVMTPCLRAEFPSAANRRPRARPRTNLGYSPSTPESVDSVQTSCGRPAEVVSPDPLGRSSVWLRPRRCESGRTGCSDRTNDPPWSVSSRLERAILRSHFGLCPILRRPTLRAQPYPSESSASLDR